MKELRGFEKISLEPAETKTVRFRLTRDDLTMLDANLHPVVEPGTFKVMVGRSSADVRAEGEFELH